MVWLLLLALERPKEKAFGRGRSGDDAEASLPLSGGASTLANVDIVGCLACDLTAGRQHLPGGSIIDADGWRVEHCVGPLGVGTLVLKPLRHVTRVAELTHAEAAAQGILIHRCAVVIETLLAPAQTYVCLWSHAGGKPAHIHYVIQPVTDEQIADGVYGPRLQVEMLSARGTPNEHEVEQFADKARELMGQRRTEPRR